MYLVAQRLVTAAVTKHGPCSPGLLPSWLLSEVGERRAGEMIQREVWWSAPELAGAASAGCFQSS